MLTTEVLFQSCTLLPCSHPVIADRPSSCVSLVAAVESHLSLLFPSVSLFSALDCRLETGNRRLTTVFRLPPWLQLSPLTGD